MKKKNCIIQRFENPVYSPMMFVMRGRAISKEVKKLSTKLNRVNLLSPDVSLGHPVHSRSNTRATRSRIVFGWFRNSPNKTKKKKKNIKLENKTEKKKKIIKNRKTITPRSRRTIRGESLVCQPVQLISNRPREITPRVELPDGLNRLNGPTVPRSRRRRRKLRIVKMRGKLWSNFSPATHSHPRAVSFYLFIFRFWLIITLDPTRIVRPGD